MNNKRALKALDRLLTIMANLRSPGGCPWDADQTPESLKPHLLEETYEVLDAIDRNDPAHICEELGDLLLQVVFNARIFEERGAFDFGNVADGIAEKLIHRHPHVFSREQIKSGETLDAQWHRIKAEKRERHNASASVLDGVPIHLPSLLKARKLSEKASRAGFDWPEAEGIFDKIDEELNEFRDAMLRTDLPDMAHELGDLLFTIVNLGRFFKIDAEEALRQTTNRFATRFGHIEKTIAERGETLDRISPEELDALWNEAKERERGSRDEPVKT